MKDQPRYPPKYTGPLEGIWYVITDEQRPLAAEYCELMEEIKQRWSIVDEVVKGKIDIPRPAAGELCYLQLRMICELIALGCLVAHGDIEGTRSRRMRKSADAEWIIKELSRLHPSFYPVPGQQTVDEQGNPNAIFEIGSDFLTKAELLELYSECGHFLHRGSLKGVLEKSVRVPDKARVHSWCMKILVLLNHHQIQLADKDLQMVVVLTDKKTLKAGVAVLRRHGPKPPARARAP